MLYSLQLIIIFLPLSFEDLTTIGDLTDKNERVFLAKLAERAERYDDMVEVMKAAAKINPELTVEERHLFYVAYSNAIGPRLASWRTVSRIEEKMEQNDGYPKTKLSLFKSYRGIIEKELEDISSAVLDILIKNLIPVASDGESKVFYYKMMGDCHRYLADIATGIDRNSSAEGAKLAYQSASDIATNDLPPTHPLRLWLALNYSVFYYEIWNSPERACRLAKAALNDAIGHLDTLSEESYKASTLIMQLLQDRLTLWTSDDMPCSNEVEGEQNTDQEQDLQADEAS